MDAPTIPYRKRNLGLALAATSLLMLGCAVYETTIW
jgi:hypothetical protein